MLWRPTPLLLSLGYAALLTAACSDDGASNQPDTATLYSPSVTTIALEVDYATGAAPYVGSTLTGDDVWNLFGENARRMFQADDKTITYPSTLADMEELTDVTGDSFTTQEILALADKHRDTLSEGSTATFYGIWLNGFYRDESGVREDVLGVSIGDTGVLAMFKPVIAGGAPPVQKFVEQTTLIHEFGHAVGLVNSGVPLTSAHHDEEHGAHCTNQDCVMYYANEGLADMASFVQRFIVTGGNTIVFADECLADMDALVESSN